MSIQTWEDRSAVALATSQDVAVQRLGEWAQSADAAHRIATTLVQTSFCPEAFRNKPGEATAAILAGIEVGLQPMAALRSFDIIQGTAAPRAITLRAVVQSHGHDMVLVESNGSRCKMKGKRKGSDEWQHVTWTTERAQQLGLTGKSNWKSQPTAMLLARATSELARLIASDAILGIGYSAEEVADGGTYDQRVEGDTTTPAPTNGTRKMSLPKPSTPAPDVVDASAESPAPLDDGPDESAGVESEDGSRMLTNRTAFGKLFYARMGEQNFDDDQARIEYLSETVGRLVTSSKELTEADARKVLARLDEEAGITDAEEVS